MLTNFFQGTTKEFSVTISFNGQAPDITSDTVSFLMKSEKSDADADAKISDTADVASQGSSGIALFSLASDDTGIDPGDYYWEILWTRASGKKYVLASEQIEVYERVFDV